MQEPANPHPLPQSNHTAPQFPGPLVVAKLQDVLREPYLSPRQPVIGLEAEFTLLVNGQPELPEEVFGTPRKLVGKGHQERQGKSVQLPTGGALYFDTGVIEVATPIIEIEPSCTLRAVRSLWEQLEYLRGVLDQWEKKTGHTFALQGFSAHYNVSFQQDPAAPWRSAEKLALLLCHILPVPVMLLAANRRSTGIGVRPRGNRIEVTTDFTPDPDLMIATASLITGIVRQVMMWPDYELSQLDQRGIPRIEGLTPRRHTSRIGWLARKDRFPKNPFTADTLALDWHLTDGRRSSLRLLAREVANPFRGAIRAITPPAAFEHVFAVIDGRARSLLDFPDRPPEYDDAGRVIRWNRRAHRKLPRSRYERVILQMLSGRPLNTPAGRLKPMRMRGWYEVVFRGPRSGKQRTFTLDELASRLPKVPIPLRPAKGVM